MDLAALGLDDLQDFSTENFVLLELQLMQDVELTQKRLEIAIVHEKQINQVISEMDTDLHQMSKHQAYRNYAYLTEDDIKYGFEPSSPYSRQPKSIDRQKNWNFQRIISFLGSEYKDINYSATRS